MRKWAALVLVFSSIILSEGLSGCSRQSVVAVSSTRTVDDTEAASGDAQQIAPKMQSEVEGAAPKDIQPLRRSNVEQGDRGAQGKESASNDTKQAQSSLGLSSGEIVRRDVPLDAASAGKDVGQDFSRRPPPPQQVIETWRAQAEEYVKRLKILYPRDSDQYREAERRYIGAKVKFDAWLNRLRLDLSTGPTPSARVKDLLEAAYTKYALFKSYADSLLTSTSAAVSELQSPLDSKTLEDAASSLWQGYTTTKQNRDVIEAQVRQLEWKDFDQI